MKQRFHFETEPKAAMIGVNTEPRAMEDSTV